jgi:hypothetical protein
MGRVLKDGKIILCGSKLKALRRAQGLSQDALVRACESRQLRLSIATIKRAEVGRAVNYLSARKIASYHGVEIHDLCL